MAATLASRDCDGFDVLERRGAERPIPVRAGGRRLDGIPLAIELAAAKVTSYTPQQIARTLDDCMAVLIDGSRSAPPRHRTLRAWIGWSHALLDDGEPVLFRRLAVFAGSFSLEAAQAVCADDPLTAGDVVILLARLVSKSLVTVEPYPGRNRYRLPDTVRHYAATRLAGAGEADAVGARFVGHMRALGGLAASALAAKQVVEWLDLLDAERPNLRAALDQSIAGGDGVTALRLVGDLTLYFFIRGYMAEGIRWFADALTASDAKPSRARAYALAGASYMAFNAGDTPTARGYATSAVEEAQALGDTQVVMRAQTVLGGVEVVRDPQRARGHLKESAELAARLGDDWNLAHVLQFTAMAWRTQSALEPARQHLATAHGIVIRLANSHLLAWQATITAMLSAQGGDLSEAELCAERGRSLAEAVGDPICHAYATLAATEAACWRGRAGEAAQALAELGRLSEARPPSAVILLRCAAGKAALTLGDLRTAEREFQLIVDNPVGDALVSGSCIVGLAEIALLRSHVDTARVLANDAATAGGLLANAWLTSASTVLLAHAARQVGDLGHARALLQDALAAQHKGGYLLDAVTTLEDIAAVMVERGACRDAARLLGAAAAARGRLGLRRRPVDLPGRRNDQLRLLRALGRTSLRAARREGAALSLDAAIALASRGWGRRKRPARGWESPTSAELTVARLAAEGLTNPEIADQLLVSVATVKTHLTHVFSKLSLTRRSELAAAGARRLS